MASVPPSWLDDAFKSAKEDFKRNLKNPALYDFSKLTSIEDVLEEAKNIERQQAKTKTLRGLKRIQPLINGLKEYSAIIEIFAQAKPDIMSLIWGPLKFVLQASSSVISAFEKVVKVIADVGITLPSFKIYTQLFQSNYEIRRALCLFFADILDFYAILLNFLTNPKRNIILESLWPNIRSSITKVQENMDHHKAIMTANVTLQDIILADQARKRALEEYKLAQAFRDNQTFRTIRNELNPHDHDTELASILRRSSVVPGERLKDEPDFTRWRDPVDRTMRSMWLHGIPGSGKTFLVGNLIKTMRNSGQRVVFALLSHNNRAAGDTIKVLHSFLLQLLEIDPSMRTLLREASQSEYRKLKSDSEFVIDLLCKILKSSEPTFVILDGLDELDECSWGHLLASVLKINERCPETKILISSREERSIALQLKDRAIPLRVDHKNSKDIQSFVQLECNNLLLEMKGYGADQQTCHEVEGKIGKVAEMAAGMFIYARLVMIMVKDQGSIHDIETQINDLPDGLYEVYGRLLDRVKTKASKTIKAIARKILQWIACAQRPLREEELLQILAIEPGLQDFRSGRLKQFHDICKVCGPIIEINGGNVQFVHFSAKEYLLHEQSDNFLNLPEAHVDATITCTTYLSFSSLDPLFSQTSNTAADIQERIMKGAYVLFEYASATFLDHLKDCLETQNGIQDSKQLLVTLNRFREVRSISSPDVLLVPRHVTYMFRDFAHEPGVQDFLSVVMYSQMKVQFGKTNEEDIINCPISDPLGMFTARRKIRKDLEGMICQKSGHRRHCRCDDLKHLYGTNIYYCDQPFCYAYGRGFGSINSRDQHLRIHKRSHKCVVTNCLFMDIGFYDVADLDRHMRTAHPYLMPKNDGLCPVSLPDQLLDDALDTIVGAIALDQTELVKELLQKNKDVLKSNLSKLVKEAAWKASPGMLSYLLDLEPLKSKANLAVPLAVAIEVENLPNIGFLLSRGANMEQRECAWVRLYTVHIGRTGQYEDMPGYMRALCRWSPTLMAYLVDKCHVQFPLKLENPETIFSFAEVDRSTHKTTLEEARKRFNGIKQYIIWREAYTRGVCAAIEGRSVIACQICLENGGDPNETGRHHEKTRTALYLAVAQGSQKGAQMAKILLQHGADTEHPLFKVKGNSKMAQKIAGHFGLTWGEMVRRIGEGEELPLVSRRNNDGA